MKGKKLSLQEVLKLDDGTKVWVEDNQYKRAKLSYVKINKNTYDGDPFYIILTDDYFNDWSAFYRMNIFDRLDIYEWVEGKSFSDLWDSIQKAVGEIEHDCYIPFPYKETIEYKLATEICNLRGLDLTDDNIRLIVEEFEEEK